MYSLANMASLALASLAPLPMPPKKGVRRAAGKETLITVLTGTSRSSQNHLGAFSEEEGNCISLVSGGQGPFQGFHS